MRQNIMLLLISLLLMLGASEMALQWLKPEQPRLPDKPKSDWVSVPERIWMEYHPKLGWYHQKNKTSVLKIGDKIDVTVKTNSAGFRGTREYSYDKPAGVRRMTVLGDSFAFGFGVGDADTFSAVLESRHPNVEVLNLGVAAYGVDQIWMSFREIGRLYQTDVVVISLFPEDFWRATRAFADTGNAKPYFSLASDGRLVLRNVPVPKPFELNTNQFPEIIDRGPVHRWLMSSAIYRMCRKPLMRLGRDLKLIDPDLSDEWVISRAILKALIAEVRAAGMRPVLFLLPPENWMNNRKPTSVQKSVRRFAEREKVDWIDATPAFQEAVRAGGVVEYYIPGDGHWTAKGHALAADLLEKYLPEK